MVCTIPDLAYVVSLVSKLMGNPGNTHWEALKWIRRYLKGTQTTCLIYKARNRGDDPLIGYVNSDFAGSIDIRKSLTGYIFTLLGTTISWKANLLAVVAFLTTKAKYIVVSEAMKETI